jgi:MarR family transcriptional regulator, organic hydroperoxide resistance regulator
MRQAEQIRYLILAAQREGNRQLMQDLRTINLTPAQAEVIRIVGDHGHLSLSGLGELLVCETGTSPSRLVDRLVAAGLVAREASRRDRRQITLSLTDRGRRSCDAVRDVEERLYRSIDAAIPAGDIGPVIEFLNKLIGGTPAGNALDRRIAGS